MAAEKGNGNGNGSLSDNFPIKRLHVVTTVAIIIGTVSVLGWAKSTFADAHEFMRLRQEVKTSISIMELRIKSNSLVSRNLYLEDKIFEFKHRPNPSDLDKIFQERYQREYEKNTGEITDVNRQISDWLQSQRQQ